VFSTSPLSLLLDCSTASTSPVALALAPRSSAGNPASRFEICGSIYFCEEAYAQQGSERNRRPPPRLLSLRIAYLPLSNCLFLWARLRSSAPCAALVLQEPCSSARPPSATAQVCKRRSHLRPFFSCCR
jgi:hypothetical protein